MPLFKDSEEIRQILGEFFVQNRQHPEVGPKIKDGSLVVQFHYTDPEIIITVDSKNPDPGYYFNVYFGGEGPEPEVTFSGKADIGHKFWLGELNLTAALARRQLVAKGAINKALKLLPALKPAYQAYKDFLLEMGRADLAS